MSPKTVEQAAANYPNPDERRAGFAALEATVRGRDGWTISPAGGPIPNAHHVRWDAGTCHQASLIQGAAGTWRVNAWSSTADYPIRDGLALAEALRYAEAPVA